MDKGKIYNLENLCPDEELREAQMIMLKILKEVDAVCKKHNISYWMESGTLLGAVRHGGFIPWDDDLDIGMLREDYEKFQKVAPMELGEDRFIQTCYTDKHFKNMWLKIRDRNSLLIEDFDGELHQGVFIDIFPFDSYSENKFKRNIVEKFYKKLFVLTKLKLTPIKYPYMKLKNLIKNVIINIAKFIDKITPWSDEDIVFEIVKMRRKKIVDKIKKNKGKLIGYGPELYKWTLEVPYDIVFPLKTLEFEGVELKVPNDYREYLKIQFGPDYMQLPKVEDRVVHSKAIKTKLSDIEIAHLNSGFYNAL